MRFVLMLFLGFVAGFARCDAGDVDTDATVERGSELLFAGNVTESLKVFDEIYKSSPAVAPHLWQRGIALYYAERYKDGRAQFEQHQTVNPRDVENAVWHFLCVCKAESIEAARKALIPIAGDSRVPMAEIHALFAGTGSEAAVLAAATKQPVSDYDRRNHLCYAHLYLGLYAEALGKTDEAQRHLVLAATEYRMHHYMGRVAQTHALLRKWIASPPTSKP